MAPDGIFPLDHDTLQRIVLGFVGACGIAFWAHRAAMLSRSGAIAATLAGTVAAGVGWGYALLLVAFFVSSSLLSLLPASRREDATEIVAKGSRRDARQVFSNGGAFAICALFSAYTGQPAWTAAALGSIMAATADTWASELGVAFGGAPRSAVSGRIVPAGTSGAVTVVGTLAMFIGVAFMGTVAALSGVDSRLAAVGAVAGVAGAIVDTLLGATMQERRRCPACNTETERVVHTCGTTTVLLGGLRGFDNDRVNLTSTISGGLVAWLIISGLH